MGRDGNGWGLEGKRAGGELKGWGAGSEGS